MNEVSFWRIIESGGRAARDPDTKLKAIRRLLWKKPIAEVRHFQRLLNKKLAAAYTWDLFGAAMLLDRYYGVDKESLFHFCEWLVAHRAEPCTKPPWTSQTAWPPSGWVRKIPACLRGCG